jgi:TatD DNase family protein
VETDAPFLAPPPHRGKRNEPAFVRHIANFVADLRGLSPEAFARATTDNASKLFRLPGQQQ